jgi:2'-5' RNA ligase
MIRAFVAVELNEDLRAAIARVQAQVKDQVSRELRRTAPDVRVQWIRPESIHLTLKFLGDISEEQLGGITQALASAVDLHPQFSVEVSGLGVFPDARAPRVLWVGLSGPSKRHAQSEGPSPLVSLAKSVDDALSGLDFPPEARPFSPHLTVARIKERGWEVGKVLRTSGLFEGTGTLGILPVRAVALMKSELRPSGAVYTRLSEVLLKLAD